MHSLLAFGEIVLRVNTKVINIITMFLHSSLTLFTDKEKNSNTFTLATFSFCISFVYNLWESYCFNLK